MTHFVFRSRRLAGALALAAASAAPQFSAHAADEVFDNRFYVAPMGTYLLTDDDRLLKDDGFGGSLAIGKRVAPNLAIELSGQYLSADIEGADGSAKLSGATLNALMFPLSGLPNAFALFGGGYSHGSDHPGTPAKYDGALFQAGVGYLFPLSFLNDGAFRVDARFQMDSHSEEGLGAGGKKEFYDTVFNAGFLIPFGAKPTPPPPEPPATEVVSLEAPPPVDSDGDGVMDPDDKCPGTPPGVAVDSVGCPLPPPCEAPQPGQPVNLQGCAVGDVVVLHGVTFEFDSARLTANAKAVLDTVVTALGAVAVQVEIDGHTDSIGSDEYNIKLSERRAASVQAYLTENGIDASRLMTKGFGESMPVADNETDEGREMNRRVELKIVE